MYPIDHSGDVFMSTFDPAALPVPLTQYFAAVDHSKVAPLFSPEASVLDEGECHQGAEAIAAWLTSVEERYHPRYVVQDVRRERERTIVTFEVSGTFPGSPAILRQAFTIGSNQLITGIETL
jgi:hypothetical protein